MRQITLRGIPEDIENIAQEEAKSKGVSLNKAFLSLLRKGSEQQNRPMRGKRSHAKSDFDRFLGLWSEDEAVLFDQSLQEQRGIDEEVWS